VCEPSAVTLVSWSSSDCLLSRRAALCAFPALVCFEKCPGKMESRRLPRRFSTTGCQQEQTNPYQRIYQGRARNPAFNREIVLLSSRTKLSATKMPSKITPQGRKRPLKIRWFRTMPFWKVKPPEHVVTERVLWRRHQGNLCIIAAPDSRHSPFLLDAASLFVHLLENYADEMIKHLSSDLSSPPTKNDSHRLTAARIPEQLAWTPVLRPWRKGSSGAAYSWAEPQSDRSKDRS